MKADLTSTEANWVGCVLIKLCLQNRWWVRPGLQIAACWPPSLCIKEGINPSFSFMGHPQVTDLNQWLPVSAGSFSFLLSWEYGLLFTFPLTRSSWPASKTPSPGQLWLLITGFRMAPMHTSSIYILCICYIRMASFVLKPMIPNLYLMSNLTAVSVFIRNGILTNQSGIFWSAPSEVIGLVGPLCPQRKKRRSVT